MQPFTQLASRVIPLDRADVDTDQIIPKQFLKSVLRSGLGRGLFYDWRHRPDSSLDPDFVLNQPAYAGARILMARENFGCGSSREHAPWALKDFGILCLLAPSFADIFYNNCCANGMLPVRLPPAAVAALFERAAAPAGLFVEVDLETCTVTAGDLQISFDIEPHRRHRLLHGLDDIALTLAHADAIAAFEHSAAAGLPEPTSNPF